MPRISQLPSLTTADNADEIAIVDTSASTTKKITRGDLLKAPLPNNSVTTAAIANNAVTAGKLDLTTFISPDSASWKVTTLPSGKKQYRRVLVGSDVSVGGNSTGATQTVAPPTGISGTDMLSGTYLLTSTYTSNASGWDRMLGKTSVGSSNIQLSVYNSFTSSLNTGNQARWFLELTEM